MTYLGPRKTYECARKMYVCARKIYSVLNVVNQLLIDWTQNSNELLRKIHSVKQYQTMLFAKQDQIQSTVHRDTTQIQSPTPSVTTSLPFLTPSCSSRDYRARSSSYTPKPAPSECSVSVASTSLDACNELLNLDWYLDDFSSTGYKPLLTPLTQS